MRVIIAVRLSPKQFVLVTLKAPHIDKVKSLINQGEHMKALMFTLSKGRMDKEIDSSALMHEDVDLILTERNARWDLTRT